MSLKSIILFLCLVYSFFETSFSAYVAPIAVDFATGQYTISIYIKTPPQPTKLLFDLGASFSWVDCTHNYSSSTYKSIPCSSSLCNSLGSHACSNCFRSPGPGCSNDSCILFPVNSVTRRSTMANALTDWLSLPHTDGRNPGQLGAIPEFVFSCSEKKSLLKGLVKGVVGVAGLDRSNFSLSAQISNTLSSPNLFALCLSGSPSAPGLVFLGTRGPYYFYPQIDLSKYLIYTPLLSNPLRSSLEIYRYPSAEYFIGLTSIKVNGKVVQFDLTLLNIDANGFGGTKLSTVTPYTMLYSTIFKALTKAFVNESSALNLTMTEPVKPFSVCYNADDVRDTSLGPAAVTIDLVMQSDDVFWRIFGSNSMVRIVREGIDVWCLGFLDGGANMRTAVVIGGHQMEDNLLQFDLDNNRLGFSSSVLAHGTMCANFNFTTNSNLG